MDQTLLLATVSHVFVNYFWSLSRSFHGRLNICCHFCHLWITFVVIIPGAILSLYVLWRVTHVDPPHSHPSHPYSSFGFVTHFDPSPVGPLLVTCEFWTCLRSSPYGWRHSSIYYLSWYANMPKDMDMGYRLDSLSLIFRILTCCQAWHQHLNPSSWAHDNPLLFPILYFCRRTNRAELPLWELATLTTVA